MNIIKTVKRIIKLFKLIGFAQRISKAIGLIEDTIKRIAKIRKKQLLKKKSRQRGIKPKPYPKLKKLEKLKSLKSVSYSKKS